MNILYLTEDYLTSKVHNNLLCKLLEKNKDLKIYVFSPIRQENVQELQNSFIKHERLFELTPKIDIPIWRYKFDFWAKQRCKLRLLERNVPIDEIDVIHAATLYTEGCTALNIKKKFNIPYIVTVRGADVMFYAKKMPHLWSIGISVIKGAKKIACVTPSIKEKIIGKWQHLFVKEILTRSDVINNGIDDIWLDNLFVTPKTLSAPPRILYVGRFDSNKNVYRLIKAASLLHKDTDVCLTIVGGVGGNDEEHEIVMKEVDAHKDYIEYLGAIYDKTKLMEVVRRCDLFAMVSHSETFGLVYVECLTQGLPLLYSKGTGFDGIFPDGYVGYSVNSYSIEDIAHGLRKILNNYSELRQNICKIDFERFSWTNTSNKYLDYYDSI